MHDTGMTIAPLDIHANHMRYQQLPGASEVAWVLPRISAGRHRNPLVGAAYIAPW